MLCDTTKDISGYMSSQQYNQNPDVQYETPFMVIMMMTTTITIVIIIVSMMMMRMMTIMAI